MRFRMLAGLLLVGAWLAGQTAHAQGMSSANYQIPSMVINSGGGTASSANYQMIVSIGEPVIGPTSSAAFQANLGFLATLASFVAAPGDLNGDGVVNIADVKLALQISAGLSNAAAPGVNFGAGDVVGPDGKIAIMDADKILRIINGK